MNINIYVGSGAAFYLAFSIVVSVIANSRGRAAIGWFLLSMLISPLLALILVVCIPKIEKDEEIAFKSGKYKSKLMRDL
jgi:hypothetical protein